MADVYHKTGFSLRAGTVIALAAATMLGACAKRDSIHVGSVPDDYRTRHPIMIAEKEFKLDVAVGAGDRGMTKAQKQTLEGFLSNYDRSANPVLSIMKPIGSKNEVAAGYAANDFAGVAHRNGIDSGRVVVTAYQAGSPEVSAPIRVSYINVAAQTDKCGRWPDDLLKTTENKNWANFGCAYQNNLAAQIANPNDLLGPRKPTEIDAENRGAVIEDYRELPEPWAIDAN